MTAETPAAVVLLDDRAGNALPPGSLPALRAAQRVFGTADLGPSLAETLGVEPDPGPDVLLAAGTPVALLARDPRGASAAALRAAGARVFAAEPAKPEDAGLSRAVAVMDRLRSPGGCPWDAEQTHVSLLRYLVEETYELLEAIENGDRAALREELGDVLLQVLFHARIATEHDTDPFDIDDVADELVSKLVSRHPHVFAGADAEVGDAAAQQQRWEELKQREKQRESIVDGVPLAQPSLALVGKLVQRVLRADFPPELFPTGSAVGERMFTLGAEVALAGVEPEGELRAVARAFAADVRAAETTARTAGVEVSTMGAAGWRRFWPGTRSTP